MSSETVEAVVLAAGRSTRMGVPKLLLPLGERGTVLQPLIRSPMDAPIHRVVVVVGHRASWIRAVLQLHFGQEPQSGRFTTVLSPEYERGMAHSLRTGIQALDPTTTGALLVAADQPLIGRGVFEALVSAYRRRRPGISAVALSVAGELRNPVVVDESFFDPLLQREGDRGAQPLLRQRSEEVEGLEREEGVWLDDVDSWQQYRRLIRRSGHVPTADEEPTEVQPSQLPSNWRRILEEQRSLQPAPELAPGVLLLDLAARRLNAWEHLPLPVHFPVSLPARDDKPHVDRVIAGPARSGEEYAKLLRTATVWCLNP